MAGRHASGIKIYAEVFKVGSKIFIISFQIRFNAKITIIIMSDVDLSSAGNIKTASQAVRTGKIPCRIIVIRRYFEFQAVASSLRRLAIWIPANFKKFSG